MRSGVACSGLGLISKPIDYETLWGQQPKFQGFLCSQQISKSRLVHQLLVMVKIRLATWEVRWWGVPRWVNSFLPQPPWAHQSCPPPCRAAPLWAAPGLCSSETSPEKVTNMRQNSFGEREINRSGHAEGSGGRGTNQVNTTSSWVGIKDFLWRFPIFNF